MEVLQARASHACSGLLRVLATAASAQTRKLELTLDLTDKTGPMEMCHFSLAQRGQSEEPMLAHRVREVRDLRLKLIRNFVTKLFDLLPGRNHYNFKKLGETVDMVEKT